MTDITNPVLSAINMFQDHPSIKNIRAKNFKSAFSFTHTSKTGIQKIIRDISVNKTCQLQNLPNKIIKMNVDIFANFMCLHFNYYLDVGEFPQVFDLYCSL